MSIVDCVRKEVWAAACGELVFLLACERAANAGNEGLALLAWFAATLCLGIVLGIVTSGFPRKKEGGER